MLVMLNRTLLGSLILIVWAELVVPIPCEPKFSDVGETALKAVLSITETVDAFESAPAKSGMPSPLKSRTTTEAVVSFVSR